ncbi:DUF4391 domain-containing protein [Verminephrobacter aporrectodeae subsp. tuberculatae]|uniref:DUF4391 domain-containing protein n=1 Tax=Verminephrobacter aporrectodeae TaxID=1110389 RepID=UPI002242FEA8|nr:DUF4391 domain-containing protein [Verminephrobacter aporrectodeae]MCW8198238.1 DUF4391 domain-containing protein [Verminephrobacter aporrectodeae subsp. tuberculatae]
MTTPAISMTDLSSDRLIAALNLPAAATVSQRVPKKILAENAAATATDRRLLQDHIEEIIWIAALKPANAGVAEYRDEQRTYLELAVLCATLRQLGGNSAKVTRVAELVHRAIPYPVVLVLDGGERLYVSLAHIRWARKEADQTVLDGALMQGIFERHCAANSQACTDDNLREFLTALDMSRQARTSLWHLYQGWLDTVSAWQAVAVTGRFEASMTPEQAADRRAALQRCHALDARIASLRSAANKEKQMARQVAANLEIKRLQHERDAVGRQL